MTVAEAKKILEKMPDSAPFEIILSGRYYEFGAAFIAPDYVCVELITSTYEEPKGN